MIFNSETNNKYNIKDSLDLKNSSILFLAQKTLDSIYHNSGELAHNNEFQVHYNSLNVRLTDKNNNYLDICIPTLFYNYPQEVTSASIDFDMEKVSDTNDKLKLLTINQENILKKSQFYNEIYKYTSKIAKDNNFQLSLNSSTFNTIHRHPGSSSMQSFSSTDLSTTKDSLGVVYPLQKAINTANLASIVCIENNKCVLAKTEYRIADGCLDSLITYKRGRNISVIIDSQPEQETISFFMLPEKQKNKQDKYCIKTDYAELDNIYLKSLIRAVSDNCSYFPSTEFVIKDNLKQKTIYSNSFNTNIINYDINDFKTPAFKNYSKELLNKCTFGRLKEIYLELEQEYYQSDDIDECSFDCVYTKDNEETLINDILALQKAINEEYYYDIDY